MPRIYLSPPHMSPDERALLLDAFDSNWIAPLGPHVNAFEEELASYVGARHAAALSSGTAALHLALLLHDVQPGDVVLCSSFTFAATANAIAYVGAEPVFVDAELTESMLRTHLLRRVQLFAPERPDEPPGGALAGGGRPRPLIAKLTERLEAAVASLLAQVRPANGPAAADKA